MLRLPIALTCIDLTAPLLAAAIVLPACGTAPHVDPPGTGGGSAVATSSSSGSTPEVCDVPVSTHVPPGWIARTDFSCRCPIYVPADKSMLPDPIQWQPCPPLPSGVSCRVMVDPVSGGPDHPRMDMNPDGSAVLAFQRVLGVGDDTYWMDIIADADGPVRTALFFDTLPIDEPGPDCEMDIAQSWINEGRYIYGLRTVKNGSGTQPYGAFGGAIDDLAPTFLSGQAFSDKSSFGCDAELLIAHQGWTPLVMRWDGTVIDKFFQHGYSLVIRGETIVGAHNGSLHSWDPQAGTRVLVEHGPGEEMGNVGHDGTWMVWSHGREKPPGAGEFDPYLVRSVMMSPFTTDPAKVVAKRLHSQVPTVVARPDAYGWKVGCGFAALAEFDLSVQQGVFVVRLSDGVAWWIEGSDEVRLEGVMGMTCEDIFVNAEIFPIPGDLYRDTKVVRIALASLGPGMPPD